MPSLNKSVVNGVYFEKGNNAMIKLYHPPMSAAT